MHWLVRIIPIFVLWLGSNVLAATRELQVVLVRTAETNGSNASSATAENFAQQIERANQVWAGSGIHFNFDPVAGFPPIVNDTLLHHDFMLLPGQSLGQPKDQEPQVSGTLYAQAKNNYVRAHYWGKVVVFSGRGDMLQYNDTLKKWENVVRTFAYGNMPDLYVQWFNSDASINVFGHEVGHFLHLYHTHGWLPKNKADFTNLVTNAITSGSYTKDNVANMFDGDGVSDTPPDPGPDLWKDVMGDPCGSANQMSIPVKVGAQAFNVVFNTDRRNIMSYFKECPFPDGHHISAQQGQRAREAIDYGNRLYLINQNPGSLIPQWSAELKAVSWAPGRLDVFATAADLRTMHKAYSSQGGWYPAMGYGAEQWENLGGKIVGKTGAVSWGANRLDLFVRGTNNAMYHKAWDGAQWLPGITGWESLGGTFAGSPVAVSWAKGRLDIFGRGFDGRLYHKWWTSQGWGPSVSGWEDLGGKLSTDPAVVAWGPNRLDLIARGYNGDVIHKAWDGAGWHPSVTDWESLGGSSVDQPSMVAWAPNRLDLVVRGSDNAVYHKAWTSQGWYPSVTGWNSLGGQVNGRPSIASWSSGRLDIVVQGTDTQLYHKAYQEGSGWYPNQMGWTNIGGWMLKGAAAEIVSWQKGRLDMFIRNSNGAIQHKAYQEGATGWYPGLTQWEDIGKYIE